MDWLVVTMHRNRICIEDTIAYKYAKKVADREIIAGKYVIMECERFLDDIEECKNPNSEWYFERESRNRTRDFGNRHRSN